MTAGPLAPLIAVVALLGSGCGPASAGFRAEPPRIGSPTAGAITRLDVARAGVGATVYRIPALAVTTEGTLLVAFDARPSGADLPAHIQVVLRRSTDGGKSFGAEIVVRADSAPLGFGDPSLIVDRHTGRIFLFHAASMRQGFSGSATGTDEHSPDILQADYSYSDDDGLTWRSRRITAAIKDPSWGGMFASSGAGIQLRSGAHAGRLVQQYVVRYQGGNWALSVWSDDHGASWHPGALAGPGADENKVVELADGRLMLNSRASPYRKIAFSNDGGAHWSGLRDDSTLVDPGNNGSIIRYDPDADPRAADAHWLLFSNTASTTRRRGLTVRLSCDDGQTWSAGTVIEPGSAGYSTLARLPDGRFAVLYERDDYHFITLATFDAAWLGARCGQAAAGKRSLPDCLNGAAAHGLRFMLYCTALPMESARALSTVSPFCSSTGAMPP